MFKFAAVSALLFLLSGEANGFGALSTTRCNTDIQQGELTNSCGSLYDAICDGSYCKCPRGFQEDPHLHRCVRGDDDDDDHSQRGSSDAFDDLPFDFDPNSGDSNPPTRPRESLGLTDTRCSAANNPCQSFHNAICYGGHCACPAGTAENKALSRCDPVTPRRPQQQDNDDDDDDKYVIRLFSGSQNMAANSAFVSVSCAFITYLAVMN